MAVFDLMRQQPERRDEFIARIERNTESMDRLAGELLTLARLDAVTGGGTDITIDLGELLDEPVEAESSGCVLRTEAVPHASVQGNPDLLWRAIENVLRNAVPHSPPGGEVRLSLSAGHGQCCINIADQGPGSMPAN